MSGPLPAVLAPLTVPASWVYGAAVAWRNRRFDRGLGVQRVPMPVVSIGNLTAGGTGKTPVVQWVAARLLAADRRPAIALRGYRAGADPDDSDEAREHVESVPGALVLPAPDRAAAIRGAAAAGKRIDAVVLDDGFQHRRLARDLDIVLLDARAHTLEDRLLPAGWLREPVTALRRAGAIVVTHAEAVDPGLAGAVQAIAGRPPVAWTRHVWTGLRFWSDAIIPDAAIAELVPVPWLAGRPIAVMAGVARPERVRDAAAAAGAEIVHVERVRDHHRHHAAGWAAATVRARDAGAEALLVTRKDRVKLERLAVPDPGLPLVEPVLELEFLRGETELAALVDAATASD
jgi:tetraacyldisaccharide 4'-kinase